jgi:hypothetical protein
MSPLFFLPDIVTALTSRTDGWASRRGERAGIRPVNRRADSPTPG